ncbi:hypothetical protein SSCG_03742 [Streptomyces clavuligerus]|nr:hypothetical protein SSCG_03742 [Streptomyces clavuligerus]
MNLDFPEGNEPPVRSALDWPPCRCGRPVCPDGRRAAGDGRQPTDTDGGENSG